MSLQIPSSEAQARLAHIGTGVFGPDANRPLADLAFSGESVQLEHRGETFIYTGHDLAHYRVGEAMALVYEILGIKPDNLPTRKMKQVIARNIYRNFPTFTQEDVYEAFLRVINGDFDVDYETWGVIKMDMLMRVLNAYKRWKLHLQKVVYQQQLPPAPEPSPVAQYLATREGSARAVAQTIRDNYHLMLATGRMPLLYILPEPCWHLVQDAELVEFTQAQLLEFLDQAKMRVAADYNAKLTREEQSGRISAQAAWAHFPAQCRTEACRLAITRTQTLWYNAKLSEETLAKALARVSYLGYEAHHKLWYVQQQEARATELSFTQAD